MECNPEGDCWCFQSPLVPVAEDATACLCKICLAKRVEESQSTLKSSQDL
jgi:hypothetical protein